MAVRTVEPDLRDLRRVHTELVEILAPAMSTDPSRQDWPKPVPGIALDILRIVEDWRADGVLRDVLNPLRQALLELVQGKSPPLLLSPILRMANELAQAGGLVDASVIPTPRGHRRQ